MVCQLVRCTVKTVGIIKEEYGKKYSSCLFPPHFLVGKIGNVAAFLIYCVVSIKEH